MTFDVECIVVGAGVVGLAVARALARSGREVVVLEAENAIGTGISSRNSEVIHAGLYYPPDSLKARYCVRGRQMLYEYCASHGVPFRRTGKLVVACDASEATTLESIEARARRNGVEGLAWLDRRTALSMEPALDVHCALHSPETGIVDTHSLMLSLLGEAQDHGAMVAFLSPVIAGSVGPDGVSVEVGGKEPGVLTARCLVNAAGLAAASVAGGFEGLTRPPPAMRFAKGNYFGLNGRAPFSRLVYPVPEPGGLGVHLTLDMGGRARFGPDVEWIDAIDFAVDPGRAEPFYAAIRRYWPGLPDNSLHADYSGIRPKIDGQAQPDFVIDTANGPMVNLYGIESPGLTSCLAIADDVAGSIGHVIG